MREGIYKALLDDERARCVEVTAQYAREHAMNKKLLAVYQDALLSIESLRSLLAKERIENRSVLKPAA